jgi:hypothetical protein
VNKNLILGVLPALLLATIVVPLVLFWNDIPNPMATHWGISGEPDGSMPPLALLLLVGGIFVAMWGAVWRVSSHYPYETPSFAAGLIGAGGLLATVQWIAVLANRDRADWTDAGEFTGLHIVVAVVVALAAGYLGWRISGGSQGSDRPEGDRPTLDLAADQTAVWAGSGRGPLLVAIGVVLLVIAVAVWSWTSVALIGIALLVLTFAQVRATVSARGVLVSLGWLGLPSWTVPMSRIEGAEVEDVRPMSYGGWGYRLRPGIRALVVRGGPGLRIVRSGTPDLVLTVDDAATGAALINTLRARNR